LLTLRSCFSASLFWSMLQISHTSFCCVKMFSGNIACSYWCSSFYYYYYYYMNILDQVRLDWFHFLHVDLFSVNCGFLIMCNLHNPISWLWAPTINSMTAIHKEGFQILCWRGTFKSQWRWQIKKDMMFGKHVV
jgi:hypothetical protein